MEADLKATLLRAYARLLRPLIQILLRTGAAYPDFADLAKRVFVEAAKKELSYKNESPSPTRISIATGLSLKEVNDALAEFSEQLNRSSLSQIEGVLSGWHTDPRFTGPYGIPLELQLKDQGRPDFETLAKLYGDGATPDSLIRKLIAIGAVRETSENWFRVMTRTYMPDTNQPDSLERLGRTVQYLVETLEFNRSATNPEHKRFERTVTADFGIAERDLPYLQAFVESRGQVLLEEIDNWISMRDRPNPDIGEKPVETGLGIYHYVASNETDN
jgi:hypothetical protein